jgi:hypothetical protein
MTNLKQFSFILFSLIFIFSCKKEESNSVLGLDVQPTNDLLGVTVSDSSHLFMFTQKVDSIRTYNNQYKYLGSNQDPIFGQTHVSLYANFSIANNLTNVSFGSEPIADSAEIVLRFNGNFTGDTTSDLNFQVHLLNSLIPKNTEFYSNKTIAYSNVTINAGKGRFEGRGDGLYLIIPINKTLAQTIIQTRENLTNNTAFLNAYKGLYITTENSILTSPGSGAIREYDLDDNLSGVYVYYREDGSAASKGKSVQFTFRGTDALRFNHIKHKYSAGAHQNLYNQLYGDSIKGNQNVYLNSFGGTRIRVNIPFLKNFSDSLNVSISRAELIIKIDEALAPYTINYSYPSSLALIGCGETGTEELVWDQLETSDFIKYGGNYNNTNKTYTFNIARQMQKVITNKIKNYGFYLVNALPNRAFTAKRDDRFQRLVFGGKSNLTFKPVFKVTYIKFPYDK